MLVLWMSIIVMFLDMICIYVMSSKVLACSYFAVFFGEQKNQLHDCNYCTVNNREIRMIWCSRHSGVTSEAQSGRHVSDCNAQVKICWIMPEEVACRSLRHCRRGWWCSKIWILPRFLFFFQKDWKPGVKLIWVWLSSSKNWWVKTHTSW